MREACPRERYDYVSRERTRRVRRTLGVWTPLTAPEKTKKQTIQSAFVWSGLRSEQTKTTECCFWRSECAETRSNGSKACPCEQYDYVSRVKNP